MSIDRQNLAARIDALPEAGVTIIEQHVAHMEAMQQPKPGAQVVIGGATVTARPDLVYQGEIESGKASRR